MAPELVLRRGDTYQFIVYGGMYPQAQPRYHPLYITTDASGGFDAKFPAEKAQEEPGLVAGVNRLPSGQYEPAASKCFTVTLSYPCPVKPCISNPYQNSLTPRKPSKFSQLNYICNYANQEIYVSLVANQLMSQFLRHIHLLSVRFKISHRTFGISWEIREDLRAFLIR